MSKSTVNLMMIPDFRRGVRFLHGAFSAVLEPGTYRINTAKQQVTIVDMRPQPLLFERYIYRDALNRPSVISIGTELLVHDPRLATTTLKDQVKDAIPIINNLIHTAVARLVTDPSPEGRKATSETITKAVNVELSKYGLRISSAEVTEAYSQPLASGPSGSCND
jgi:hypothetical protein